MLLIVVVESDVGYGHGGRLGSWVKVVVEAVAWNYVFAFSNMESVAQPPGLLGLSLWPSSPDIPSPQENDVCLFRGEF